MTAIVVLGSFWLLGPGLLAQMLFGGRRHGQDRVPSRFEHLRATSTYRRTQPNPTRISFRNVPYAR